MRASLFENLEDKYINLTQSHSALHHREKNNKNLGVLSEARVSENDEPIF